MDGFLDRIHRYRIDILRNLRLACWRLAAVARLVVLTILLSPVILAIAVLALMDLFLGKYETDTTNRWRQK